MEVAASTLNLLMQDRGQPEKVLGEYAKEVESNAEEICAVMATLDREKLGRANKVLFCDLIRNIGDRLCITAPEFAEDCVKFYRVCVSCILPRRMVDPTFFQVVNEVIFDHNKHFYGGMKMPGTGINWKFGQQYAMARKPQEHLNDQAVKFQQELDQIAQNRFVAEQNLYQKDFENWRDALQVNDYIDIQKLTKITSGQRTSTIIAWKRAKIMTIGLPEKESEKEALERSINKLCMPRTLKICYLGEQVKEVPIKAASPTIAPVGMHTDGWDWRMSLQKGDQADLCDEIGIWYKGMIIDRRVCIGGKKGSDCDGNPIEEVQCAFREFNEEFGINKDKNDQRYIGFGDKFDIWRNITEGSIMPLGSINTPFINITNKAQVAQKNRVEDEKDIIYLTVNPEKPYEYTQYRKEIVVREWTTRERIQIVKKYANYSSTSYEYKTTTNEIKKEAQKLDRMIFVTQIINEFGKSGGFHRILEIVGSFSQEDCQYNIQNLIQIMRFLQKTTYFLCRQFNCWFAQVLQQKWLSGVVDPRSKVNQMSKEVKKEQWKIVSDCYAQVLKRYMVDELFTKHLAVAEINLAICGLKQDNLEKRIASIKLLNEQLNRVESTKDDLKDKSFLEDFKKHNVFGLLFTGQYFHAELAKRAGEIFKVFVKYDAFGQSEVEQLWEASQMEESVKLDIYNLLTEAANVLNDETISNFIEKINTLDPANVTNYDLEFLCNLAKKNKGGPKEKASAVLWNIATLQRRGYAKKILQPARDQLIALIKAQDRDAKDTYALQCCSIIGCEDSQQSSIQAMMILKELLESLPSYSANHRTKNKKDQVISLIQDHNLLELLFTDFNFYIKQIQEKEVHQKKLCQQTVETLEIGIDRFTHKENLEARIDMLLFLLETCDGQIEICEVQLNQLHDNLLNGTGFAFDSSQFYKWFRKVLEKRNKWIDPTLVQNFFREKILANPKLVHGIEEDGFTVISQMFLQANEMKGSIDIISNPGFIEEVKPVVTYSSNNQYGGWNNNNYGNYNNNYNKSALDKPKEVPKLEFRVFVHPKQLEGIEIVWAMFENAILKNTVNKKIVDLLAKIYQESSQNSDENDKADVYGSFIEECFTRMKSQEDLDKKNQLVRRTMHMWRNFLGQTEIAGTMRMRQHNTINNDSPMIKKLLVIPKGWFFSDAPEYFVFNVESTMTQWELFETIGKELHVSPLDITLERTKGKSKMVLEPVMNCQTLDLLKFGDSDEIEVKKKIKSTLKVPLYNSTTNQCTRQAQTIFTNWFDMFASDHEVWEKILTKKNAAEFLTSCQKKTNYQYSYNQPQKISEYHYSVTAMFKEFDEEKGDKITKDQFLSFMRQKCKTNVSQVWEYLTAHRLGPDLKPIMGGGADFKNDPSVTSNALSLPRVQISDNQAYLNDLFTLDDKLNQDTSSLIWTTISMLKTNNNMFMQILNNDDETLKALSQPDLLANIPIHKLLYLLQIVKYLVQKVLRGVTSGSGAEVNIYFTKPAPEVVNVDEEVVEEEKQDGQPQESEEQPKEEPKEEVEKREEKESEPKPDDQKKDDEKKPDGEEKKDDDMMPQEGENISENFKKIRGWKGEIRKVKLEHSLFGLDELKKMFNVEKIDEDEDQEISKALTNGKFKALTQNWLVDFLSKGGFPALMNILTSFIEEQKIKASDFTVSQNKCLQVTIYIIKVILLGCFSCNDPDKELAETMLQKISSTMSEESSSLRKQRKESLVKAKEQPAFQNEDFSHLIKMLTNAPDVGLTSDILDSLDSEGLVDKLQTLFQIILKFDSDSKEQVVIIEEGLSLWVSLVSYNTQLLEKLYVNQEQKKEMDDLPPWEQAEVKHQGGEFVKMLVDQGLLGHDEAIRAQFKRAVYFVCMSVKKEQLTEQPASFFLRLLLAKLNYLTTVNPHNTTQYFDLFSNLMQEYFKRRALDQGEDLFKETELLHEVMNLLFQYSSIETKFNAEDTCDNTLVGLLAISTDLLEGAHLKKLEVFEPNQAQNITDTILHKLLFGDSKLNEESLSKMLAPKDLDIFETASGYKCHGKKSREAAYELFLFVAENYLTPVEFDKLIRVYWTSLVMRMERPPNERYDPNTQARNETGFAGLKNQKNTCYMNSMIQQFYNVPIFRYSMMAAHDRVQPALVEHNDRLIDDNFLHQLQRLFSNLALTDRVAYNTRDFCFSYKDMGQPVDVSVQQDASEFLNVAFDRLEQSLKKTQGEKYLMQNTFQGEKANLMVCGNCGNKRESAEDFYLLSVQVKDKEDIHSGLKHMINGETINDFYCEHCKKKVDLTKKAVLKRLPNTMIVHLNRIIFDMETFTNKKVNDRFEFPQQLNLREFMLDEVNKVDAANFAQKQENEVQVDEKEIPAAADHDEGMIDTNVQEEKVAEEDEKVEVPEEEVEVEIPDEEFEYKLVGVVIHMGSAQAGHYYSYINIEREQNENFDLKKQQWLEFNDSLVRDFDVEKDLDSKCFGAKDEKDKELDKAALAAIEKGDFSKIPVANNHNAYMLVYEKRVKAPFKIDIAENLIEKIKGANQHDMEADLPDCFRLYPQLFSQVQAGLNMQYDADKNEHYALVNQANYNKFVPVRSMVDVLWDNHKYLSEKQVFTSSFFETTTHLFEKVITNLEARAQSQDVAQQCVEMFNILDRLIFDLIMNSKDLSSLTHLTLLLLRVAFSSPETLRRLLNDRIFKDPKLMANNEKNFFEVMVKHQHPEVRQMASDILQHLFARTLLKIVSAENRDVQNEKDLLAKIFDGVMLMMVIECPNFFWKCDPVFDFFRTLICEPKEGEKNKLPFVTTPQRKHIHKFFKEKNLVSELLTLVTKHKANDLYSTESTPPFSKVVEVISTLVRQQPIFNYDYDKEEQPVAAELRLSLLEDPVQASPYFKDNQSIEEMLQEENIEKLSFISEQDVHKLFLAGDTKDMKNWIQKFLIDDYSQDDLAQLLGHMCWKNEEMSKRVGKFILTGSNEFTWKQLKPAMACARVYMSIPDEFQQKRIEWLLGFPNFICKEPNITFGYNSGVSFGSLKVGANRIDRVSEQTYDYNTCLFKEPKGDHDTYLQNIFKYRLNKHMQSPILMLDTLIQLLVDADPNQVVLKYLLTINGPSYVCNRYWDWIESHVNAQINDMFTDDDKKKSEEDEHLEIYMRLNANIVKINEMHADLIGDINNPATHELLGTGPGAAILQEPYLIWDTKRAAILQEHKDDVHDIGFQVAELICEVSRSVPTGTENECLQQKSQKMYYSTAMTYSIGQKNRYSGYVKPVHAAIGFNKKGGKGKKKGKKQRKMVVQENKDGAAAQEKEPADGAAAEPIVVDAPVDDAPQEEQKDEAPKEESESEENSEEEQSEVVGPVKFQVDKEEREKVNPCLVIAIKNSSYMTTKTIRIKWNQELKQVLNFRFPSSDSLVRVPQNKSKIALCFTKIHPADEWGPIDDLMKICIHTPNRERRNKRVARPLEPMNDDMGGGKQDGGGKKPDSPKKTCITCSICTFENEMSSTKCDVCESPL